MAIYGNTISFGGGGSNDTLPPLLDNFKATRLEGGIVPPTANTLAFKDIPDGSKIKLVKGSKIIILNICCSCCIHVVTSGKFSMVNDNTLSRQ